jgi:hypothetical protein
VNPVERRIEFLPHVAEWRIERRPPPDQHIIVAVVHAAALRKPHDLTQPAPHPVALHRIADLPRDGEADPHRSVVFGAPARLYHESAAGSPQSRRRGTKVRPAGQPLHGNAGRAITH